MARLDRLGHRQRDRATGRDPRAGVLATSCSTPSRRLDEETLQQGLQQLVEAELLYQRGLPPQAHVSLQACADSGHGLSVVAQEHPPAVSPADCPGVGGTVSRDRRDAAGAAGASLHRGGPHRAGHSLLAAGRAASHPALGQCGSDQLTSPRGWSCSRPCRTPPSAPSKN